MHFIDGDRAVEPVSEGAVRHPVAIAPFIGAQVPHPGRSPRTNLGGESVRVCLIDPVVPELRDDVIFVQSPWANGGHETLPNPGSSLSCRGWASRRQSFKTPITETRPA